MAAEQRDHQNIGDTATTRRKILAYGGAASLAAVASPLSRRGAAGAQDATPAVSPEVDAFYTPAAGAFDGKSLTVVINASFFGTDIRKEALETLRTQFNELTGASVEFLPLPENQMYDQVRLELSTGSGTYDMMHSGAGGAKEYGLSNFLVPLPAPPDVADFYEGDVAQYTVGDQLYGMPMIADINILYWRKDLFEEAGLDPAQPPTTYDQFREYARMLTVDKSGNRLGEDGFDPNNIAVFGTAYKGTAGLAATWEWYNYLYAFGGDLMDAEYNPILNSPEAVASLGWVVENFQNQGIYPPDITTYDYTEFHTLFLQGQMAMAINWPYMWGMAKDPTQSKVMDKVAVGLKPQQTTHGGNIGGWSWNVFAMSKNQDVAIAFAKWMASPVASLVYAQAGHGNPVRKSVAEAMTEQDPELYQAIAANQETGRSVGWLATGPSWLEIEKVQYEAIQRALIGDVDAAGALEDANAKTLEILQENKFYEEIAPQLIGGA